MTITVKFLLTKLIYEEKTNPYISTGANAALLSIINCKLTPIFPLEPLET